MLLHGALLCATCNIAMAQCYMYVLPCSQQCTVASGDMATLHTWRVLKWKHKTCGKVSAERAAREREGEVWGWGGGVKPGRDGDLPFTDVPATLLANARSFLYLVQSFCSSVLSLKNAVGIGGWPF